MEAALEDVVRLFERGGPVMWPLLGLSVLSLGLTLERGWFWARLHRPGRRRRNERLIELLRRGDEGRVREETAGEKSLYAEAACDLAHRRVVPESAGPAAIELTERYRPTFERFAALMATIITASPLLGILGTVLGIIGAFDLLGAGRVDDVAAVAGGIAQALITTAFGLVVALLTLFPAMLFRAQGDVCLGTLERFAAAAGSKPSGAKVSRGGESGSKSSAVSSVAPVGGGDQAVEEAASSLPRSS